jgi:ComF family protein
MSRFCGATTLQLLTNWAMEQDCTLCGARAGAPVVCRDCEAALPRAPCGEGAIAAFEYRYPVDRLVQRFKFAGDLAVGRWLALQLAHRVRVEPRPDLLVPPPLTRARLRERGFNQSLEIARIVGRELGVPHARAAVRKVRDTPPQQGLGGRERRANLRGAFRCDVALAGRRVAIVDDVLTTGATAGTLSAVLRAAGASSVAVWTVALAPRPGG